MEKQKAKDRRTMQVMVRLNRGERAALRDLAKKLGESEAAMFRRLLREESAKVA